MITIYTAIFGDYDTLKEPLYNDPLIEYVCFTDKERESKNWDVRVVPIIESSPRREARKYKILSHKYIDNEISLWIDGSRYINTNPIPYINEWLHRADFCTTIHPVRDCVYTEAAECIRLFKGNPKTIVKQMRKYKEEEYPSHNGMIMSGVLLRNRTPEIIQLEKDWWKELSEWSVRDQLSFNYIAWKNKFNYGLFDWRKITSSRGHK